MARQARPDPTQAWLDRLSGCLDERAARHLAAAACLLQAEQRHRPQRTLRPGKLRLSRWLRAFKQRETLALLSFNGFLTTESLSATRLARDLPRDRVRAFLAAGAAKTRDGDSDHSLVSFQHFGLRGAALFNPANGRLIFKLPDGVSLIDWALPDARELFADLPTTTKADRRRLNTVTHLSCRQDESAAKDLATLIRHRSSLESLDLSSIAILDRAEVSALRLERLRWLRLGQLTALCKPGIGDWLAALPALTRLESHLPWEEAAEPLRALRAARWWPRLESLTLQHYQLNEDEAWRMLWANGAPALRELRLRWLTRAQVAAVLAGDFPQLRALSLQGSDLGADYLSALSQAPLPCLEDLDLRSAQIGADDFLRAAPLLKARFPTLRRIGIAFASDRRVDYYDWSGGAPVDWGYEMMTAGELKSQYLSPWGFDLLDDRWPS